MINISNNCNNQIVKVNRCYINNIYDDNLFSSLKLNSQSTRFMINLQNNNNETEKNTNNDKNNNNKDHNDDKNNNDDNNDKDNTNKDNNDKDNNDNNDNDNNDKDNNNNDNNNNDNNNNNNKDNNDNNNNDNNKGNNDKDKVNNSSNEQDKSLVNRKKGKMNELVVYQKKKDNSNFTMIEYDIWNKMDDKKKNVLLDLNFYFRRIDKIFSNINDLKEQMNNKYKEADKIIENIQSSVLNLSDNEKICYIEEDINTLNDLINVAKKYGSPAINPKRKFTVDVRILHRIIEPLEKLRDIIGMDNIKDQIVEQILTSLQSLYEEDLMFHTVIKGPPGVGKTMLSKVLGEIYYNMGILKNSTGQLIFKIAKRSDLIGKYLGHTAAKTQEFIDKCVGGVMFIDEVYSLVDHSPR